METKPDQFLIMNIQSSKYLTVKDDGNVVIHDMMVNTDMANQIWRRSVEGDFELVKTGQVLEIADFGQCDDIPQIRVGERSYAHNQRFDFIAE